MTGGGQALTLQRKHQGGNNQEKSSDRTCVLARGTGAVLLVAGDAPVAGVGQGVVVLVDHR